MSEDEETIDDWIRMGPCDCCDLAMHTGAAVAFGLMGMAEAIRARHDDTIALLLDLEERNCGGDWCGGCVDCGGSMSVHSNLVRHQDGCRLAAALSRAGIGIVVGPSESCTVCEPQEEIARLRWALSEILQHTSEHGDGISPRWLVSTAATALGEPEPKWIYGEPEPADSGGEGQEK
jgi:hypothetical protein